MDEEDPFENGNPFSNTEQPISGGDGNRNNTNGRAAHPVREVVEGVAAVTTIGVGGIGVAFAGSEAAMGLTIALGLTAFPLAVPIVFGVAGGTLIATGAGFGIYLISKKVKQHQE